MSDAPPNTLLWKEKPFARTCVMTSGDEDSVIVDQWQQFVNMQGADNVARFLHFAYSTVDHRSIAEFAKKHTGPAREKTNLSSQLLQAFTRVHKVDPIQVQAFEATVRANFFLGTQPIDCMMADMFLYENTSFLNNRCLQYNCTWQIDPESGVVFVYSTRDIRAGDKLTLPYRKGLEFAACEERKIQMLKTLGFECACEDCQKGLDHTTKKLFGESPDSVVPVESLFFSLMQRFVNSTNQKEQKTILCLVLDKFESRLKADTFLAGVLWGKLYSDFENKFIKQIQTERAMELLDIESGRVSVLKDSLNILIITANYDEEYEAFLIFRAAVAMMHLKTNANALIESCQIMFRIEKIWEKKGIKWKILTNYLQASSKRMSKENIRKSLFSMEPKK